MSAIDPSRWIEVRPEGLYCVPGGFHVDPVRPVERAVVTHGHSDHARPGHRRVLATRETLAIMAHRHAGSAHAPPETHALAYGERIRIGEATVWLVPAGHVLGSAQVVMEHGGSRVVVSGDYKREPDPTCPPFEPVPCDAFVTEATFGLPVFRHPPAEAEIARLLRSVAQFPERAHLVGVYGLGKCQRVLMLLRMAGWDGPIWLHGALVGLTALYRRFGFDFEDFRPATGAAPRDLAGAIVLAPPSAAQDRWSRRLPEPRIAMASGWMRVRAHARRRGVELPLVISDHVDWPGLIRTIREVGAGRVWVTHGREEAVVHAARAMGHDARALSLVGFEEEGE